METNNTLNKTLDRSQMTKKQQIRQSMLDRTLERSHINALNISKQNPFRTGIAKTGKKKAQKLVPKVSSKSKNIDKGKAFAEKLKRKGKKLNYKKKD